jgi:hypothetical protein
MRRGGRARVDSVLFPFAEPGGVALENPIRETLFGDMPLSQWAHGEREGAPWNQFGEAQEHLEAQDADGATKILRDILAEPKLEVRHTLQAWNELRQLGVQPGAEGRRLLGVVVEVALDEGLDILAAYADGTARYINYSGAAVIWEGADDSLEAMIHGLLDACTPILGQIGPWKGPRPGAPPRGQARLSMLTPAGLFFGQAPLEALMADRLAAPAMNAAIVLMQALITRSEAARGGR